MSREWVALRRAVVSLLPAIDPAADLGPVDGGSAPAYPAFSPIRGAGRPAGLPKEVEGLPRLLAQAPLRRGDASDIIHALNALDWFARLPEAVAFAVASAIQPLHAAEGEVAIPRPSGAEVGAARAGELDDGEGAAAGEERLYLVLSGMLALRDGLRTAAYLHPGQLWASFACADAELEAFALRPSALLLVARPLFAAALAARAERQLCERLDFLASVPLLAGLGREALRPLARVMSVSVVLKGAVLVRQGEPPAQLSFVTSGQMRVLRHVPAAAFERAAQEAAAASWLDALGEQPARPQQPLSEDERSLAAAAAREVGKAEARRLRAAGSGAQAGEPGAAPHPLEVAGTTLEVAQLGPRAFFGELAILNEPIRGRAHASVVALTQACLLSVHAADFLHAAGAQVEAAFRGNSRAYQTDAQLVALLAEGRSWRAYKRRLTERAGAAREPGGGAGRLERSPPGGARGGAGGLLEQRYYAGGDDACTPVLRSALFDMAVRSAQRAAAKRSPAYAAAPGRHRGRPPPVLPLPEIAARMDASAVRAGVARAGLRTPGAQAGGARGARAERLAFGAQSAAGSAEEARQWDKFKSWGISEASRARYNARFERHLREAERALARQSLAPAAEAEAVGAAEAAEAAVAAGAEAAEAEGADAVEAEAPAAEAGGAEAAEAPAAEAAGAEAAEANAAQPEAARPAAAEAEAADAADVPELAAQPIPADAGGAAEAPAGEALELAAQPQAAAPPEATAESAEGVERATAAAPEAAELAETAEASERQLLEPSGGPDADAAAEAEAGAAAELQPEAVPEAEAADVAEPAE